MRKSSEEEAKRNIWRLEKEALLKELRGMGFAVGKKKPSSGDGSED